MKPHCLTFVVSAVLATQALATDWGAELKRTGKWLVARQKSTGELQESEYFDYVYQIDTVRAVWVWAEYQRVTGDTQFRTNMDLAWTYIEATPSYNEVLAYLRLESCGWSLKSEMLYSRLTGDTSHEAYAIACADYIANNFPDVSADNQLFAAGQAALFLYEWAVDRSDSGRIAVAEGLAATLRSAIESDPTRLDNEVGEEAAGMAFAAIATVAFDTNPDGRKAWVEQYRTYLDTYVPPSLYNNCHNAWYCYAHDLAWEYGAEKASHDALWTIATDQIAQDGDSDGGIPRKSTDNPGHDATWSTEVYVFGPFNGLYHEQDLALVTADSSVPVGGVLKIDFGLANNLTSTALCFLVAFVDIPGFGGVYLGAFSVLLPAGFSFAVNDINFSIAPGSPTGNWKLRTYVYNAAGKLQDEAILPFKVQ
ncbi:MAG: hypothetical protein U1E76_23395 [Planctomycetota bacterium]